MKQFIFIVAFLCMTFSCKEGDVDTQLTKNIHSGVRTNADLIITTPTTLSSSASYGLIEIRNGGNLTITNGATITCDDFKSVVNHIYATFVDIHQGATLDINNVTLPTSINPITTIHIRGVLNNKSMEVFGNVIVYASGVHNNTANLELYSGRYKIDGGVLNNVNPFGSAVIFGEGGKFTLEHCGKAYVNTLSLYQGNYNFEGKGRIKADKVILYGGILTANNTLILCAQNYYYNGGSLGSADTSCLRVCIEF